MSYPLKLKAEAIREVAAASIAATLTAVGGPTQHPGRLVRMVNTTDKDVYVSLNGIDNNFRIPTNSFLLLDISTNQTTKENFFIPEGQVFYVAYIGVAPISGSFWIEYIIGG